MPSPQMSVPWIYALPPDDGKVRLLFTRERQVLLGVWRGRLGEHFIAWTLQPRRDRVLEKALIARGIICAPST